MLEKAPLKEILIKEMTGEDKEKYGAIFNNVGKIAIKKLVDQLIDDAPIDDSGNLLKEEIAKQTKEIETKEFKEKVIQMWHSQETDLGVGNHDKLADGLISRVKHNIGLV